MPKRDEMFCFTVEGSGEFPFDMLRYDSCWPFSEGRDVPSLVHYGPRGRRRVVLQTTNQHAPTAGRWQSFNWRVIGKGELRDASLSPLERIA